MIEFIVALACGMGGLFAGFLMSRHLPTAQSNEELGCQKGNAPQDVTTTLDRQDAEQLKTLTEQLRRLAATVVADVSEHQAVVTKANDTLADCNDPPSADCIISTVSELINANQSMQKKLEIAKTRIREQAAQLQTAEEIATTDALTQLKNRRALDDFLTSCQLQRPTTPSTLALLDVDHFKKFNDTHGHLVGDQVLRMVSEMLRSRFPEDAFVARYGGEEFAVVFSRQPAQSVTELVEQVRVFVSQQPIDVDGKLLQVTSSAGVAELLESESVAEWIERADRGLYKSKAAGRNCCHLMNGNAPVRVTAVVEQQAIASEQPTDAATIPSKTTKECAAVSTARFELSSKAAGPASSTSESQQRTQRTRPSSGDVFSSEPGLPAENAMREMYNRLAERLSTASVELYVLVVRRDQNDQTAAADASILRVVRASMRSLDNLGCLDCGDLLICMPSANEAGAVERAQKILRNINSIPAEAGVPPVTVSVGVAWVRQTDAFEDVKKIAKQAAAEASRRGGNRIEVANEGVSAT